MVTYKYRIPGEPLIHVQEREGKTSAWNTYKHQKVRALISLEGQHDFRPQLTGPLAMDLHFFIKDAWSKNELSIYIKFIEHLFADVVYPRYQDIVCVNASRTKVTEDPHTLIIISEIQE